MPKNLLMGGIDVGTGEHMGHVPLTFHILSGKVPLFSLKSCQFLFMSVTLNTHAPTF